MVKKIMLIVPNYLWCDQSTKNTLWHFIPYNLCLLAAVLEQENKYDITVFDALHSNTSREDFAKLIKTEKPDFVGISVLMDFYGSSAHIAAEIIKNINPTIITCVGGVYATTNSDKVIKDSNIDYVICGEGEIALNQLIKCINDGVDPNSLKGIWYKSEGQVIDGGHSDLIENLDDFPLPAYHLIDYHQYSMKAERKSLDGPAEYPYARILTSRGCPYNCCFCQVDRIAGRKFRPRSAEKVLEEIDWLIKNYNVKSLIFDDDNLLTDRKRAIKIFNGLIKYKIKWKMIATAAFLLDDELIELMRQSGCIYVDIAIESGCERILHNIINKPLKLDKAISVIDKLKKADIYVAANFIIGFPGETWEEIRKTVAFAEACNADYIKLFNAVPLPGTRLYDLAVQENALVEDFDSNKVNWRNGFIETEEFSARDLAILRAYEWDRINFSTPEKIKKTADMMDITIDELNKTRKESRRTLQL